MRKQKTPAGRTPRTGTAPPPHASLSERPGLDADDEWPWSDPDDQTEPEPEPGDFWFEPPADDF